MHKHWNIQIDRFPVQRHKLREFTFCSEHHLLVLMSSGIRKSITQTNHKFPDINRLTKYQFC